MRGKYGSTLFLECYYCHKWGHILNNLPQIPPYRVRGGGGIRGGGARTGGRCITVMLHICIFFIRTLMEWFQVHG